MKNLVALLSVTAMLTLTAAAPVLANCGKCGGGDKAKSGEVTSADDGGTTSTAPAAPAEKEKK